MGVGAFVIGSCQISFFVCYRVCQQSTANGKYEGYLKKYCTFIVRILHSDQSKKVKTSMWTSGNLAFRTFLRRHWRDDFKNHFTITLHNNDNDTVWIIAEKNGLLSGFWPFLWDQRWFLFRALRFFLYQMRLGYWHSVNGLSSVYSVIAVVMHLLLTQLFIFICSVSFRDVIQV